jgi:hypothetical protein
MKRGQNKTCTMRVLPDKFTQSANWLTTSLSSALIKCLCAILPILKIGVSFARKMSSEIRRDPVKSHEYTFQKISYGTPTPVFFPDVTRRFLGSALAANALMVSEDAALSGAGQKNSSPKQVNPWRSPKTDLSDQTIHRIFVPIRTEPTSPSPLSPSPLSANPRLATGKGNK